MINNIIFLNRNNKYNHPNKINIIYTDLILLVIMLILNFCKSGIIYILYLF